MIGHFYSGFEPPLNELEFLRRRLREQQAMTEHANKARLEAESRCHVLERERDIYRLLSLRYKNRLNEAMGARVDDEEYIEHDAAEMLLEAREAPAFGVGNLFRRFRNRVIGAELRGPGDSDDDDDSGHSDEDSADDVQEDDDSVMDEDQEDESEAENDVGLEDDNDDNMEVSMIHPQALKRRSKQPRTVSMSDDDL
jgi:hypothetical protein